jgi:hypothetical protein
MPESPLQTLERWELNGATWRTKSLSDEGAIVTLFTCHGEPVDELHSADAELLSYLADRPSSEDPPMD